MKKIELNKNILDEKNYSKSKNKRYRYITKDVRITAYDATKLCFDAISAHNLGLIEGKIFSQAALSALMISEVLKNPGDAIVYEIECNGPIGGVHIECKKSGELRGFVINNPAKVSNIVIHSLSDFIGAGFISCTKHIEGLKESQKSSVMIETGNIPHDTAVFFQDSEQINTTVAMWVNIENNIFKSVQGLLVQAMPGADERALEKIENITKALDGPYLSNTFSIENFIEMSYTEFSPKFLGSDDISFFCPCSKEHYVNVIKSLSKSDDIFKGEESVDVSCQMCSSSYKIMHSEII